MAKLYNLPKGSWFTLPDKPEYEYHFHHLDGMYSYCTCGEEIYHFAAWTEVIISPTLSRKRE